ncbi:MAG: YHS domain-containing protein [Zoogloeaceae bacterium]|nr:YHS domain-containing protein [Zoogloeaceae bacterium]
MTHTLKDVVCGMEVEADSFAHDYAGTRYAFCSAQCRDRFLAHPHLFIGFQGNPAPKQEGRSVLKRRSFDLQSPLTTDQAQGVVAHLGTLMGIVAAEVEGARVRITYDLLQVSAEAIEAALAAAGARLGDGWAANLKRGFVHFTEECEIGNLEVGPRFGSRHSSGDASCHGKH